MENKTEDKKSPAGKPVVDAAAAKPVKQVKVVLEFPFDYDGREITSLTFRRMKTKDSYVGEDIENPAKAGFALFAALAGVKIEVIEELDIDDLEKVSEETLPLMGKSALAVAAAQKKKMLENQSNGET